MYRTIRASYVLAGAVWSLAGLVAIAGCILVATGHPGVAFGCLALEVMVVNAAVLMCTKASLEVQRGAMRNAFEIGHEKGSESRRPLTPL